MFLDPMKKRAKALSCLFPRIQSPLRLKMTNWILSLDLTKGTTFKQHRTEMARNQQVGCKRKPAPGRRKRISGSG